MEISNKRLCEIVHNEILKYKPALQKTVITSSYNGDDADQEFIGQNVIKSFPLPVGIELRRLFSTSLRLPDIQRLDQIFSTIERSLQFLSYILVSQLWHEKKINSIVIPESFAKIFRQKIYLRNIENFIWIIQSVSTLIEERSSGFFAPEIKDSFDEKFLNGIEFSEPSKNQEGHYIINGDPAIVEKQCLEAEEKLTLLLGHLAFLVNYKLVSVQQIKVIKPKYQQPKYNHVLKLLTCIDSDFNSFEMQDSRCADSHSVLLVKSQLPINENLNLSPLIIDTASFLINDQSAGNVKKDLYLYDGSHDSRMNYRGCRVTDKCDLSALPDYPMLVSQFSDMLETICS